MMVNVTGIIHLYGLNSGSNLPRYISFSVYDGIMMGILSKQQHMWRRFKGPAAKTFSGILFVEIYDEDRWAMLNMLTKTWWFDCLSWTDMSSPIKILNIMDPYSQIWWSLTIFLHFPDQNGHEWACQTHKHSCWSHLWQQRSCHT